MKGTKIYLDNAATTPLAPEVLDAMLPVFRSSFGNPSSIHAFGREARSLVENARKTIARLLQCSPSEIFFCSCATEANNWILKGSAWGLGVKHILSSKLEHHAVLHALEWIAKKGLAKVHYLQTDENGCVSVSEIEDFLKTHENVLVSLMHGNNEIGNINPIEDIARLCNRHKALFHSDTVQTIGHRQINLKSLELDFIVGSAHKFHGPKGVGFVYINARNRPEVFLHGGAQERAMRGGTENVAGIVGLAKALEISYQNLISNEEKITKLKAYLLGKLSSEFSDIRFNGKSGEMQNSLAHVLSISTPEHEVNEMLLFNLDIAGIAVSGGSACTSGAIAASHVLEELKIPRERGVLRFSFSAQNSEEEVSYVVQTLKRLIG